MIRPAGHLFLLYLIAWTCVPAVQPMPSRKLAMIDIKGMVASSPPPGSPPPTSPSPSSPPPASPSPALPPSSSPPQSPPSGNGTTSTTASPPPPVATLAPSTNTTAAPITISKKAATNAAPFCFGQYCNPIPPPPPPPIVDDGGALFSPGKLFWGLLNLPAFITGLFFIPWVAIKSIADQTPLYVEAAKAYAIGRPDLAKQLFDRSEWEKGEYLKSALANITKDVRSYWSQWTAPVVGPWVNTNASSTGWQGDLYGNGTRDILFDSIGVPSTYQFGKLQIGRKLMALIMGSV